MKKFFAFIRNALMIDNNDNSSRVGLSQFKNEQSDFSVNKNSITSKDVKLSDLLRRA